MLASAFPMERLNLEVLVMNNVMTIDNSALTSMEVAGMVEKEHSKLLRDIRRYIRQLNEANFGFVEFFEESTYKDSKGENRPCFDITRKGCEFIAHKMTGRKERYLPQDMLIAFTRWKTS